MLYYAEYATPSHPYKPEELEVVMIAIHIDTVTVKIPTFEEMMKFLYKEKEPDHYAYIMQKYREHKVSLRTGEMKYSLYDLREWQAAQLQQVKS